MGHTLIKCRGRKKNGFGFSLSIHGFLVEKWNFPTEGAGVPPVSVHNMFHLLLLFWKCNYLRYRGLNGDSLAGERFHLPKASFLVAFPFFLPQVAPPSHLSGRKQSGFLLTGSITLLAIKKNPHIFTFLTQLYYHFLAHLLFPKFIRNENERCSPKRTRKSSQEWKKHFLFLFLDPVFNSLSTRRKTRWIIYQFSRCSTRVVFPSLRGGALNQYMWNPSTPDNSAPNVPLSTGKKVGWGFMSCAVSCQICKTWHAFWFY